MKKNTNPGLVSIIKNACLIILMLAGCGQLKAANYYWVGGAGDWSDYANHWATTSGGTTFHTALPDSTDDVFFDSNSSADTVNFMWSDGLCRNITILDTVFLAANNFDIYGSLQTSYDRAFFSNTMWLEFRGNGPQTISTTGSADTLCFPYWGCTLTFNCPNGVYTVSTHLTSIELLFVAGTVYFDQNLYVSGNYLTVNCNNASTGNNVMFILIIATLVSMAFSFMIMALWALLMLILPSCMHGALSIVTIMEKPLTKLK